MKPSQRLRERRRRAENSSNLRHSGAGSQFDYGQMNQPGSSAMWLSIEGQNSAALTLFTQDWQARKIVTIPVDDMLREGWEIEGLDDEQGDRVEDAQDKLAVLTAFTQAMQLEFLFGGAAIYLGVQDGQDDPSQPLDEANVPLGGFRFLNVVPRTRVQRVEFEMSPLKATYGRPAHYWIDGVRVHRSRLVVFDGDPLLPVPISTIGIPSTMQRNDGFGDSKLLPIMDDLTRATGSRQAAFQLVQRAGVFFAQGDFESFSGTEGGDAKMAALADIVNQVNAFRGAVIDVPVGSNVPPLATISPAFGSVPELVMSFLQVLSAASDIPATRFLGQAPGGLNATGESDLENYYGRLESRQRSKVRPRLLQVLRLLSKSLFGNVSPELDVKFPPLWSLSEKEVAETNKVKTDTLTVLVEQGFCNLQQAVDAVNAWEILPVTATADEVAAAAPDADEVAAPPLAETLAAMELPDAGDPAQVGA